MKRPDPQVVWRTAETAGVAVAALLVAAVLWVFVTRTLGGADDALDASPAASLVAERNDDPGDGEGASPRGGGPSKRLAAALQAVERRNIFNPPAPKGFQGRLTGILGDRAIFNGSQWAGVGDNVMGAKVLAIGPDWVEVEFEGEKRQLKIFGDGFGSGDSGGGDDGGRRGWRGRGRGFTPPPGFSPPPGGFNRQPPNEEMRRRFQEMRERRRAMREERDDEGQE